MLPDSQLVHFLLSYGYFLALPIMVVGGPIATTAMAVTASFGFFNPYAVFGLGFVADLVADTFFYFLGYYFGEGFISRFGRFVKLSPKTLPAIKEFYIHHGGKSIFFAKILTGLVPPIFIFAGYSKMPLKKFYGFAAAGGLIWSAGLVIFGYHFGRQFQDGFSDLDDFFSRSRLVFLSGLFIILFYKFYLHRVIERHLKYLREAFKKGD